MDLEKQIRLLVDEHFDNTDKFLANVKISSGGQKIQVFVDQLSKNISIDACVELSRLLEKKLEEAELVPEKYVLEVSSPGMGNPFYVPQQFQKNLGRNVEVLLIDGQKEEGLLKKYDGTTIVVEAHIAKKKKGVPPEVKTMVLLLENIKSVKKKITFKK